jgi:hypothetical protein
VPLVLLGPSSLSRCSIVACARLVDPKTTIYERSGLGGSCRALRDEYGGVRVRINDRGCAGRRRGRSRPA